MRGRSKSFPENVREKIFKRALYQCENFKHPKCLCKKGLSIHHIIANTKMNAKLYGDKFLQSAENAIVLCQWCHDHQLEIDWIQEKRKALEKSN